MKPKIYHLREDMGGEEAKSVKSLEHDPLHGIVSSPQLPGPMGIERLGKTERHIGQVLPGAERLYVSTPKGNTLYLLSRLSAHEPVMDEDTIPDMGERRDLTRFSQALFGKDNISHDLFPEEFQPTFDQNEKMKAALKASSWQAIGTKLARLSPAEASGLKHAVDIALDPTTAFKREEFASLDGIGGDALENVKKVLDRRVSAYEGRSESYRDHIMSKKQLSLALRRMRDGVEPDIRVSAAKDIVHHYGSLARIAEPERQHVVRFFMWGIKDEDPEVRSSNAEILGLLKSQQAVGSLGRLAVGDQEPLVRESAAHALGRIRSTRAILPLVAAANDTDTGVNHTAWRSLSGKSDPGSAMAMARIIKSSKDEALRTTAAQALAKVIGRIDDAEAEKKIEREMLGIMDRPGDEMVNGYLPQILTKIQMR